MTAFRAQAAWRWLTLIIAPLFSLAIVGVVVAAALAPADPQSHQTVAQGLAAAAIALAIAGALALAPWSTWTARLWLSDSGITYRFGFRTREVRREHIRSYSIRPGIMLGFIPVQPSGFTLRGSDNRVLMEIPGYFDGRRELVSYLDSVTTKQ